LAIVPRIDPDARRPLEDDAVVLAALRQGDEEAFGALIARFHPSMLRVARSYVATREAAEDVVQETWLGVINGLARFEERSSLKTWIFRILVNRAKTRGEREARSRPFSSLESLDLLDPHGDEPAVDPGRFNTQGRWAGLWASPPSAAPLPEDHVVIAEAGERLLAAIDALPASQRLVITLRDVQGLSAAEVCDLLQVSEGNQRVLLHRARSKARAALESYLDDRVGRA
jgi:RNA polymerase sigma-70 factor (ECF subfamily)